MSSIKLFNLQGNIKELQSQNSIIDKDLQIVIEKNMKMFFGVTLLASEYQIDDEKISSIGIDENNCPVIFEYKQNIKENVINQGIFHLKWLLEHKDIFKTLVLEKLGSNISTNIDWTMPRIICIADNFTKYDKVAITQIMCNISLIKYAKYGNDYLMFEQVKENIIMPLINEFLTETAKKKEKTNNEKIASATNNIKNIYKLLDKYISSMGDDVSKVNLKNYIAYKKIKNFLIVNIFSNQLKLYLPFNISTIKIIEGFSRDASEINYFNNENVEIIIKDIETFDMAKRLIDRAYNET